MRRLVEWVRTRCPGAESPTAGAIEILHADRSTSTMWLRSPETPVPAALRALPEIYGELDGADLFSSAFKIASLREPKRKGAVTIVTDVATLTKEAVAEDGCEFPDGSIAFMYQAGIGYYAVAPDGRLWEWDTEWNALTEIADLFTVFDEWLDALGGELVP